MFKVPRLPNLRRPPLSMLRMSSHCLDPSMVTIPEEREEQQQQEEENKEKGKHHQEQKDKEQQQQQHKEKQADQQEGRKEKQVEVEKVSRQSQEKTDDGDSTATTSTRGPRKRPGSDKSPSTKVTAVPEGHKQSKRHRGQEDTLTKGMNAVFFLHTSSSHFLIMHF